MGGQRAEDERDGVGVGLDEADALRGGRFVGDEVAGGGVAGGIGVGARTAARTDTDTVTEVAAEQARATESGADAAVAASVPAPPATSAAPASPVTHSVPAAASEPGSVPDPDKAPAAKPVDPLAVDPTGLTDSQIVGRRLALARQHAGLSIEEVVAATRIRPGMLREIESGEFVHCGGDVYARGHVRAIAKVVGIDPEPLLAEHPPFVPTDLPVRGRSRVVQRPESGKASGAQAASADEKSGRSDKRSAPPASNAVPTSAARDNAARFAGRASSRVIRPAAEGAALGVAGVAAAGKGAGVGAGAGSTGKGGGSGSIRPPHQHRKDDPGKIERHPKSANWTAAMLVALLGLVVFAGVQLIDDGGGSGKPAAAAAPAAPAPKPVALKPAPPVAPPAPKGVAVRIAAVGSDSWLAVTGPDGRILFDNLLPAGSTQNFQDPKELGVT
ncbi:helix-turn-helix domain-containing protein, partial [Catenulispora sp. NF23]|uniref:helix-turn-helix domain-containing protein n=1 Tax=Catenulispora pinistramenti TaxID=2705254 RepID=UPI001BA76F6A